MATKKVKSGWQADFFVSGRGSPRIRKTFAKKYDAEQFEIKEKAKAQEGNYKKPAKDNRTLLTLVEDWYRLHGATLKDGARRASRLRGLVVERLKNPKAYKFTAEDWITYRTKRLGELRRNSETKTVSPNNLNREHAYLGAAFSTLIKLKNWNLPNPLQGVPKLRIDDLGLTYLELEQIDNLLDACKESTSETLYLRVKLCLHTGARWGEAGALTGMQVRGGLVHYVATKNNSARAVPIAPDLEAEILENRPRSGVLFPGNPKRAFYTALKNAGINLPDGQATHVLRHTYASHYMINDGNLRKLQEALGHKDIKQTVKYAKLAPKHLSESLHKNPLAHLTRHKVTQKTETKPKKTPVRAL